MRHVPFCLAALLTLASSPPALALDQLTHRSITEDACKAAGFDSSFCARVGVEDGNVDAHEWDDMAAHAQATSSAAMCEGARATLARLHAIGAELQPLADQMGDLGAVEVRVAAIEAFADALGRAMHTFQDLCAHQGMTNMEHAWFSASDQCRHTESSPDIQPAAIDCAKQVTADVFSMAKEELAKRGAHPEQFPETTAYEGRLLPAADQLCTYLHSANHWDGKDHRWQLETMKPLLNDALFGGWRGETVPEVNCATLEAPPLPDVATMGNAIFCDTTEGLCEAADGAEKVGCGAMPVAFASDAWPLGALAVTAGVLFRRRTSRR